jgi:hypothetical protein
VTSSDDTIAYCLELIIIVWVDLPKVLHSGCLDHTHIPRRWILYGTNYFGRSSVKLVTQVSASQNFFFLITNILEGFSQMRMLDSVTKNWFKFCPIFGKFGKKCQNIYIDQTLRSRRWIPYGANYFGRSSVKLVTQVSVSQTFLFLIANILEGFSEC